MKTDLYAEYQNAFGTNTNAKSPSNKFSYKEYLRGEEDLETLRQRAIRGLYNAAVAAGKYPAAKPTVRLVSSGLSFTYEPAPYVLAEVVTL